jgi:hypothetical protein
MRKVFTNWRLLFLGLLSVGILQLTPTATVYAQDPAPVCTDSFLTFPSWYRGLTTADCEIESPTVKGFEVFIWTIVLNVVEIILNLVGYVSVGFIIYGGYKYMISAGSPDGMVAARKTILNAVIGLVISIGSVAIVRTIAEKMGGLG